MLYLAIISPTFRKSSLEELERTSKFKIIEDSVYAIVIDSKEKKLAEKLLESKPVFVYNIFPLKSCSKIGKDYLGSIYKAIPKALPKSGSVKIECFDINSKKGYSAKDIEVHLGQRLEKSKHSVNIENPDFLLYLVLINMKCYLGLADYNKMDKKFINPERHYHPYSKDSVSRSELKLMQAFNEFKIQGEGIAIDLGAAPGGWSKFLASSGFKVVAIDNGDLDYKNLRKSGLKVKILANGSYISKYLQQNNIVHIKSDSGKVKLKGLKANLLLDDMNLQPSESAKILLSFAKNLEKNGKMVMTVKCIDRKAEKHIHNAVKVLSKKFKIKGTKVLPSNRQEVTLFAEIK